MPKIKETQHDTKDVSNKNTSVDVSFLRSQRGSSPLCGLDVGSSSSLISQDGSPPFLGFDMPSSSSQPSLQFASNRRPFRPFRTRGPFRGFDSTTIDQTELKMLKRILNAAVGGGGCSEEVTLKEGGDASKRGGEALKESDETLKKISRCKRKLSSAADNNKTKLKKVSKALDFKSDKENSVDLLKKAQAKTNFSKEKSQSKQKIVFVDKNCSGDVGNKDEQNFLGSESKNGNFVNTFNNLQRGIVKPSVFHKIAEQVALKSLRWFQVFVTIETSDLRVTALAWHPSNARLFVSGGKAGTLGLYKIDEDNFANLQNAKITEIPGIGPGGTMEAIKFNGKSSGLVACTASVDGSIASYNFDTSVRKPLVESTDPYRVWFCSVDIHQDGKSVYGADSTGSLAVHRLDSGKTEYGVKNLKVHSSKIRHVEFNPRDPNLMVTSSLDRTVKLWDIRKLDGKNSFIENLEHNVGVSAAKFSRTDGCRLLMTDLFEKVKIFKAPFWKEEHSINHPHRHFQHLTIIRASWHPRADVFVVGRYPDPKSKIYFEDLRSVDVFSATTGRLCHELTDTSKLITSLAEFNSTGSVLATSSGRTLYFWQQRK